ncbi:MAG: type II secretion system minor pseudopilin GspI [Gammaproteobacteria bacterium]|nr:type II secretion system minor pseudopilin GspI [Gammaproteobacteria bacterium]
MQRMLFRRSAGFTLIEVMVALVVATLALVAVMASISQMIDAGTAMRERTYASWIGQNKITEMRLANTEPDVSESSGEVEFAGLDWGWTATVSETGVEFLYRVDVAVGFAGRNDVVRTVTGFIGEPGLPGEANRVWSLGGQAVGEDQ